MALPNFISPPTVGQQQTINGTTYEWDGTKWFVIQATRAVDHNATTNRNAVGAHDDIYVRIFDSIESLKNGIDSSGQPFSATDNVGLNVLVQGQYEKGDGVNFVGEIKDAPHTSDNFRIYTLSGNLFIESLSEGRGLFNRDFSVKGMKPEMIAHRGFRNLSMQNTMLALTSATKRGADSLEFDLQVTSDGVVVVYHDDTVDALTSGTGSITTQTLATVQGFTFDALASTVYSTERIPKFEDVLVYAKRHGLFIYPEIKKYRTQSDIDLMLDLVISYDMQDMTMFQSFNFSDLEYVRSKNKRVYIGFLDTFLDLSLVRRLSELGRGAALVDYVNTISNPSWVQYCYSRGVDYGVWTVNDVASAQTLVSLGVTKIMSDFNVLGGLK